MKLTFKVSSWFDVEKDEDGDTVISFPDDNGNRIEFYIKDKWPDNKWRKKLIEDLSRKQGGKKR